MNSQTMNAIRLLVVVSLKMLSASLLSDMSLITVKCLGQLCRVKGFLYWLQKTQLLLTLLARIFCQLLLLYDTLSFSSLSS